MQLILDEIRNKLNELPFTHQMVYCYVVSDKLYLNYETFALTENTGNIQLLKSVLYHLLQHTENAGQLNKTTELISELDNLLPDFEAYRGNLTASFAIDTCSLYYECLEYIIDKNPEHLSTIIELSIRSLETHIQERDNLPVNLTVSEINEYMLKQPLILKELAFQLSLIHALKKQTTISTGFIKKLHYDYIELNYPISEISA